MNTEQKLATLILLLDELNKAEEQVEKSEDKITGFLCTHKDDPDFDDLSALALDYGFEI